MSETRKAANIVYVIQSDSEEGYWSNEWGWTGFEEATHFSEEESRELNLPMSLAGDAKWVAIETKKGE